MSTATILHSVLAIVLVVGYVILNAIGHDGTPLLYFLGGQAVGGVIQKKTGDPLP